MVVKMEEDREIRKEGLKIIQHIKRKAGEDGIKALAECLLAFQEVR